MNLKKVVIFETIMIYCLWLYFKCSYTSFKCCGHISLRALILIQSVMLKKEITYNFIDLPWLGLMLIRWSLSLTFLKNFHDLSYCGVHEFVQGHLLHLCCWYLESFPNLYLEVWFWLCSESLNTSVKYLDLATKTVAKKEELQNTPTPRNVVDIIWSKQVSL